jgi:phytoene dehydrogenase-like protein
MTEGTAGDAVDAVVVGGGINGMAAAARLARGGWSVALVDDHDRLGGFIASEERTLPGFVHDTFSSWHPLFVTSPVYAQFGPDLHRHGLEYVNSENVVTASVSDDGRVAVAHRDVETTIAGLSDPRDRVAYRAMIERFAAHAPFIGGLLGSELHSPSALKPLLGLGRAAGRAGLAAYTRDAVTSGRAWMRSEFRGREVDHLWAPWLLHAGLTPDSASGALMVPVFAATLHAAGLPVVRGGAGRFVAAWERLLVELGVRIHTGRTVERILVADGVARGVAGAGFEIRAERAVLASVTPPTLYGQLLPPDCIPPEVSSAAARYRPGRAAMQIHVALSGPVPWSDARLAGVPLVHISDGSGSTGIACAEAEAGLLPRRPTVVVGQQHLLDDSRVPEGCAALWLQLQELPPAPIGDAAGDWEAHGVWDEKLAAAFANRVLDRVATHAPGLTERVLAVDVISPADLSAHSPTALHGDPYGGSAELDQNFWWRPLSSSGGHATAVRGLWHIGSATHPGPGLGGVSGHLVASRLTEPGPVRRLAARFR